MTKHELAVIMAYTGVTTLVGEDFGIFHKYAEDLMGRPVYTHEFGIQLVADEIKKRSEPEFIKICQTATSTSNWISVNDKLPETIDDVIVCNEDGTVYSAWYSSDNNTWIYAFTDEIITHHKVTHWMSLPEPPKESDAE